VTDLVRPTCVRARDDQRRSELKVKAAALFLLSLAALPGMAAAQPSAIHRQPLENADFPGGGLHTVVVRTTIDPAGVIAPHLHAGLEMAYDAPARDVAAASAFQVPPRTRHSVRNTGETAAVVVSTYIVDPAAPLATPAP